jgi:hypothetical protein
MNEPIQIADAAIARLEKSLAPFWHRSDMPETLVYVRDLGLVLEDLKRLRSLVVEQQKLKDGKLRTAIDVFAAHSSDRVAKLIEEMKEAIKDQIENLKGRALLR